jgi:hypothetical protein
MTFRQKEQRGLRGHLTPPEVSESEQELVISVRSICPHPSSVRIGEIFFFFLASFWFIPIIMILMGVLSVIDFHNNIYLLLYHLIGSIVATSISLGIILMCYRIIWRFAHKEFGLWTITIANDVHYCRQNSLIPFWGMVHSYRFSLDDVKIEPNFTSEFDFGAEFFVSERILIHNKKKKVFFPLENEIDQDAVIETIQKRIKMLTGEEQTLIKAGLAEFQSVPETFVSLRDFQNGKRTY